MRYAILILVLAFALPADAERRYFVQTSDSKIVGLTDDDGAELLPGTTAVLESTIRAATPPGADGDIIILGKWDGVNYTAPSGDGILQPLDLTTDVGMLKEAAYLAHDQLIAWREALEAVSLYYPAEDVAVGHDYLTFGHRGVRGVMLSTFWSVAERVKFAEEMATGAADVTTPAEFFELIEQAREDSDDGEGILAPTQRCVWVNPTGAERFNLAQVIGSTEGVEANMVAEVDDYTIYANGAWIDGITE